MAEMSNENAEVVSPGNLLKQARLAKGLTTQQVASHLNLLLSIIEMIEADAYDASVPTAFYRGYLRSYASYVELSADEMVATFNNAHEQTVKDLQSLQKLTAGAPKPIPWGARGDRKLVRNSIVLLSILLIVTAATFIGIKKYLPQATDTQSEQLVLITEEAESGSIPLTVKLDDDGSFADENFPDENLTDESFNAENTVTASSVIDTSITESAESEDAGKSSIVTEIQQETVSAVSDAVDLQTVSQSSDKPVHTLQFNFRQDCWVKVIDGLGEVQAVGEKKAGYEMTVQAVEPVSVTIGQYNAVALQDNGQLMDLSKYARGKVARFVIGE